MKNCNRLELRESPGAQVRKDTIWADPKFVAGALIGTAVTVILTSLLFASLLGRGVNGFTPASASDRIPAPRLPSDEPLPAPRKAPPPSD